jgi:hypothetical protein
MCCALSSHKTIIQAYEYLFRRIIDAQNKILKNGISTIQQYEIESRNHIDWCLDNELSL